jgi:hypothetical protein
VPDRLDPPWTPANPPWVHTDPYTEGLAAPRSVPLSCSVRSFPVVHVHLEEEGFGSPPNSRMMAGNKHVVNVKCNPYCGAGKEQACHSSVYGTEGLACLLYFAGQCLVPLVGCLLEPINGIAVRTRGAQCRRDWHALTLHSAISTRYTAIAVVFYISRNLF